LGFKLADKFPPHTQLIELDDVTGVSVIWFCPAGAKDARNWIVITPPTPNSTDSKAIEVGVELTLLRPTEAAVSGKALLEE